MDTVELLAKFADPEVMKTLSMTDRLVAGLITTVLGMGITFLSLVVLQFVIGLMAKLGSEKPREEKLGSPIEHQPVTAHNEQNPSSSPMNDDEIVAAITTALALQLKTSVSKIIIRNIEKVETSTSAWHKAGISEQMNNPF